MNSISRIVAIVRADFLLRFRRVSTLVVFLLLSVLACLVAHRPRISRRVSNFRAVDFSEGC